MAEPVQAMGIKFYCPNGHKIHVKSFLAGKRGICPDCGVSVTIPKPSGDDADDNEGNPLPPPPVTGAAQATAAAGPPPLAPAAPAAISTAPAVARPLAGIPAGRPAAAAIPSAAQASAVVPAAPAYAPQPLAPVAAAPLARAVPAPGGIPYAVPAASAPALGSPVMGSPVAVPVGGRATPLAPVPPAAPTAPPLAGGDPIAERPLAVWYVRPSKSAEQFGPARGEIMRRWLGEGRVPADALVWREDWEDWKPAREVFPALLGGAAPAIAAASPAATPVPSAKKSTDRLAARRKSQNTMAWAAIVMLGLLTLVMLGVLVYVLLRPPV